jgi:D-alanyl-D-alanine carboxypeptidase
MCAVAGASTWGFQASPYRADCSRVSIPPIDPIVVAAPRPVTPPSVTAPKQITGPQWLGGTGQSAGTPSFSAALAAATAQPAPAPATPAPFTAVPAAAVAPFTAGPAAAPESPPTAGSYSNLSGDLDANPELLARLNRLAASRGERWTVTSGLRTDAEQAELWANRANNPFPVARPGTSVHRTGDAADVTIGGRPIQDVVSAAELRAAGIEPLSGDAVHVQLPGT